MVRLKMNNLFVNTYLFSRNLVQFLKYIFFMEKDQNCDEKNCVLKPQQYGI